MNVFVFPCGSEIGLELNKALSYSTHFKVIGGGSVPDHGVYAFSDYIADMPFLDDARLLPRLQEIIRNRGIELIFPAHDTAVTLFSQWAEEGKLQPAQVVGSASETCRVARSKRQTYARLSHVVPTPRIYDSIDQVTTYPVFLKPDVGQGSKRTYRASELRELEFYLAREPDLLTLEFLPGKEYTVDCFTAADGALRFAQGRERCRIMNGISVSTMRASHPMFAVLAKNINDTLKFRGAWFFQVKENARGELVLLEIAPRIAGASSYHRVMGVNLPLLSAFDRLGREVEIQENTAALRMDRSLHSRYQIDHHFDCVYVDLDDTLVRNRSINAKLLAILYQFKNENKKLFLVTRHREKHHEPARTMLTALFIEPRLFDGILEVSGGEKKSAYVTGKAAIFIDDSFTERKDVARKTGALVFDVSQAIELFG